MQDNLESLPLISIGISFYNAEKYLADAIKSIIFQTYDNWELLLIDDGSTDNSLAIADQFSQQDARIKILSDGGNKGLAARLNQSIKLATGDYIARMDADDIMHPRRLEKQLTILQSNPDIDVLGTNAYVIDETSLVFGQRYKELSGLEKVESFIHPTIMGEKIWFLNNIYDEEAIRIEDAELWYRTKKFSNFMVTYEPLLFYREFGDSYYKKYIQANLSQIHLLNKYPNDKYWRKFFQKNLLKSVIYKIANIIGREQILINRRNEVIFPNKKTINSYF
ncbi:glycosyltransferase family 2 protein [Acinetobacter sp. ANC 5383]